MIRILFLLFLSGSVFAQSTKISDMPAASTLTGTELIPIVQSGSNKKATATQFKTFSNGWPLSGDGNVTGPVSIFPITGSHGITIGEDIFGETGGLTSYLFLSSTNLSLRSNSGSNIFGMNATTNGWTIGGSGSWLLTDNRPGVLQKGIQYSGDYSANYSARSLIDKGFSDATYVSSTALNTELLVGNGSGDAIGRKIFSSVDGDIEFGNDLLSGSNRSITAKGSSADVGLTLFTKGAGKFTLRSGSPFDNYFEIAPDAATFTSVKGSSAAPASWVVSAATGLVSATTGQNLNLVGGNGFASGSTNAGNVSITSGVPNSGGSEGSVNIQTRAGAKIGFFNATPVVKQSAVTTSQGIADALTAYGLLPSSTISGGGGISSSAGVNEIMKFDGTNAVPSGLFNPTTGTYRFGTTLSATNNVITMSNSVLGSLNIRGQSDAGIRGGDVYLQGGSSLLTNTQGGDVWIDGGLGDGTGVKGSVALNGNSITLDTKGFNVLLKGNGTLSSSIFPNASSTQFVGSVQGSGAGVGLDFLAGNGSGTGNLAGSILLSSGGSSGTNITAGNIVIQTGTPSGSGSEGSVLIQNSASGKLGFFGAAGVVKRSAATDLQTFYNGMVAYGLFPAATLSGGAGTYYAPSTIAANATNADFTAVVNSVKHLPAATLTANRTITIPVGTDGDVLEFYNNEAAFSWLLAGATVYLADRTTVVTALLYNVPTLMQKINGLWIIKN